MLSYKPTMNLSPKSMNNLYVNSPYTRNLPNQVPQNIFAYIGASAEKEA